MEELKSAYPLIHNKVTSPHYVTPTLRRARLLDWLNQHADARAVVIAAAAGYGKTTLLWQWEREVEFPCYWYKLDRNDRDWTLHISYLVEAISQHYPGFGRRAHSVLRQMGGPGSSRPGVAAYLLAEMHERLTEPCTFFIDDWQYVASVTEVRGLWNQILRDAPPTCRFVFASRGKPQLQFARFKTHGGYGELRTDELRMTEAEITELFRDVYDDPLTASEAAELERRTEGWAASLQLVEVSLRERRTPEERRALIDSITATSDSDLFAFLAEEVMEQQTEETRNFLMSTSILQQITAELAERLAGVHDGVRRLLQLEHAGLFTYRLDEFRYRYHGLFRDFLERKLVEERSEAEVVGLHIHAASYYETSAQWPESIYHYLKAGLQRQAARLIARYGEDIVAEGRLGLADEWLQQLPEKTIRDNARLSLLQGEALGIRGEWEAALASLERSRDFFARKHDRRMEALALVKESSVFSHWGKPSTAAEMARGALRIVPETARDLRLRLDGNLAITSLWLREPLQVAERALMRVTAEASQMGYEHYAAIGLHNLGALQLEMGKLEASIRSLYLAERFWRALPPNPFSDNFNLVRALVAVGNLQEASRLADEAQARTQAWPRPFASARLASALVRLHMDRGKEALDCLRDYVFGGGDLGVATEVAMIQFLETSALTSADATEVGEATRLLKLRELDPRLDTQREAIVARTLHARGGCARDCCAAAVSAIDKWRDRGALFMSAAATLVAAPALLEHERDGALERVSAAIETAAQTTTLGYIRPWLRTLRPWLPALVGHAGIPLLTTLVRDEPGWWGEAAVRTVVNDADSPERRALLELVERSADVRLLRALEESTDPSTAQLVSRLATRFAPRLYINTFGGITVHKGSWAGPPIPVTKKRTLSLLGLLVARGGDSVSRDQILDALWPEADPSAAVNSLNQTLFQLRRSLEPHYRDGRSPQYITSSADGVELNPQLVRLDWVELLRRSKAAPKDPNTQGRLVDLVEESITGQFLSEMLYDDWSMGPRQRVHDGLRAALLPLALDPVLPPAQRLKVARALANLDPFDESAQIALTLSLAEDGQRIAARAHLETFIARLAAEFEEPPSPALVSALAELRVKS